MKRKIKIAIGQMLVESGQLESNLNRAGEMICKASSKASDIIVLPECLDVGWTYPDAANQAYSIPGYTSNVVCEMAKEYNIFIVAGLTESYKGKIYNAAVLISNKGEIMLHHRKISELPFALELYSVGDRLNVVETEFGRIGIPICADLRPKNNPIGNTLGLMGARLLLSPSSWAVQPNHDNEIAPYGQEWIDTYKKIARNQHMFVVGGSNVGRIKGGKWDQWKCIGCSLAIAPNGEILTQGSYGEKAEELLTFVI